MKQLTALQALAEASAKTGTRSSVDQYFNQLQTESEDAYLAIEKLRKIAQSSVLKGMIKNGKYPSTQADKMISLIEAAWKAVKELDNEIDDLYMEMATGSENDQE
jgi:hypothetical protein